MKQDLSRFSLSRCIKSQNIEHSNTKRKEGEGVKGAGCESAVAPFSHQMCLVFSPQTSALFDSSTQDTKRSKQSEIGTVWCMDSHVLGQMTHTIESGTAHTHFTLIDILQFSCCAG
jgi:hypothetical protein